MVGQQGQAEGKPQEAGGICGSMAGAAAGSVIDSVCPI